MEMLSGIGDWKHFEGSVGDIFDAAKDWKSALKGVDKPWLCWHVSEPWTRLQIELVKQVGWTPVIGFDPDCGENSLTNFGDGIVIDFNKSFGFKKLYMHFPLEFAFLWTDLGIDRFNHSRRQRGPICKGIWMVEAFLVASELPKR
jgi:hypothetical protein